MGKVLQFSAKPPAKFGFERVKKRRKTDRDVLGQLNLFAGRAQILHMPRDITPFEEALLLDERGDKRAEESYRNAISEGDCVADAYCNLGILESKGGRTGKAFDCFTKSLQHGPRHFESHYNLGNLYFDSGDLRLARMHYEMASEVEPTFPNLYFNLALALALSEDFRAAVDALSRYKKLAPKHEGEKADDLLSSLKRSMPKQT